MLVRRCNDLRKGTFGRNGDSGYCSESIGAKVIENVLFYIRILETTEQSMKSCFQTRY
jgi:hypothetical protein